MKRKYLELRKKISAYNFALGTISFDAETIAPKDAFKYRASMVTVLDSERLNIIKSDEYFNIVESLTKEELDPTLNREIELQYKSLLKNKFVPKEMLLEFSTLSQNSAQNWELAREKNDFDIFKDSLNELIKLIKKITKIQANNGDMYDFILDDFEEGYSKERYDIFFNKVKEEIIPLINEVKSTDGIDFAFSKKNQREFIEYLIEVIGFDLNKGYLSESIHPFTAHTQTNDVRLTVAYDDTLESIFSAFHELGHAMYEQNINPNLNGTFLESGVSPGIHESQSRFYENIIGRSKAFWSVHLKKLQELFPELELYSLDEFYNRLNVVKKSLIRVAADEMTYPVHILIRYEVEKYIFSDEFDIDNLKMMWNDLHEKYLGIRPTNDLEGILQDIHWSWGYFGYFPTYALGSAISAQIYYTSSIDINNLVENDKIAEVNEFLKEKIHKYGCLKTPSEIIKNVSGEDFNADYYVKYLKDKYTRRII